MKALKITGAIILIAALAAAGLVYYGLQNLDGLIKAGIEKYGSQAVGTEVTVEDVNVTLQQGRIEIIGLQVANPPGYNTDYAMAIGRAVVQVTPESLTSGVIQVEQILVDAASVIAEEQDLTRTNLTDINDNLNAGGDAAPADTTDEPSDSEPLLFLVSQFQFSNANVSLVSEEYGDRTLDMPTVSASNLGSPNGLTPQQLAVALMDEIVDQATSTVKKATRDAAKQKVRDEAKEAVDENLSDEDKEKLDDLRSILDR